MPGNKQTFILGADLNCITSETWNNLKRNKAQVFDQVKGCDKRLFAYGTNKQIDVLGSFKAKIKYFQNETYTTIYVCTFGSRNIMSRETAVELNLVSFNINKQINSIKTELPKMKGVL